MLGRFSFRVASFPFLTGHETWAYPCGNLDSMWHVRGLTRRPAFTLMAITVLAVGIGVNAVMFSITSSVLLHPVPWKQPDRLVLIQEAQRDSGDVLNPSTANYADLRDRNDVFDRMAASRFVYFNLSDSGAEPERVQDLRVTGEFFRLIGVEPVLGRLFLPAEEQPGGDHVVLLANGFWRRRYASDPAIVGRTIVLEGESCEVVGVLPQFPMFQVLSRELDIYTPLTLPPAKLSREDHSISIYARLRPGVSVKRAQSEIDAISLQLAAEQPTTNTGLSFQVTALADAFTKNRRPEIEFLMSAAGLVLLIACANIASLTLASTVSRQPELAVRVALGAGRLRIVRQLMSESLAITLTAAAAGLLVAGATLPLLNRSVSHTMLGRMTDFRIDAMVLAFTAGISIGGCLLFGLGPAIVSSRLQPHYLLLGAASRGVSGRSRMVRLLIACEMALATTVLTGAAVIASSTARLLAMDRGIDPRRVLIAQLWLPSSHYPGAAAERQFVDRLLDHVRSIPGVERASVVNYPPLGLLGTMVGVDIEGRPAQLRTPAVARFRIVDPEFFGTLRVPLVAGRPFTSNDDDPARGVAIVSESFAHQFFAGEDPIGRFVRPRFPGGDAFWYPDATNQPLRIVGIARNLREDGIDVGPASQFYLPYAQNPSRILHLLVRTQGAPLRWAPQVRSAVLDLDHEEPLFQIGAYRDILRQTFSRQIALGDLLSLAAALALILAVSAIYSLLAWAISRQGREIGIRKAVGAAPWQVVWFVARQVLGPALAGIVAGFGGALALHAALTKLVEGTDRLDYAALAMVSAALILAVLMAAAVPLRRALRIDPVTSLRFQ